MSLSAVRQSEGRRAGGGPSSLVTPASKGPRIAQGTRARGKFHHKYAVDQRRFPPRFDHSIGHQTSSHHSADGDDKGSWHLDLPVLQVPA